MFCFQEWPGGFCWSELQVLRKSQSLWLLLLTSASDSVYTTTSLTTVRWVRFCKYITWRRSNPVQTGSPQLYNKDKHTEEPALRPGLHLPLLHLTSNVVLVRETGDSPPQEEGEKTLLFTPGAPATGNFQHAPSIQLNKVLDWNQRLGTYVVEQNLGLLLSLMTTSVCPLCISPSNM